MGEVTFSLEIRCSEGCSDQVVADAQKFGDVMREAFLHAMNETGVKLNISRSINESGGENFDAVEVVPDTQAITPLQMLQQLLVDADEVARRRGDEHGLCDSIDNSGNAYPSAVCSNLVWELRHSGVKPLLFLKDLEADLGGQEK